MIIIFKISSNISLCNKIVKYYFKYLYKNKKRFIKLNATI